MKKRSQIEFGAMIVAGGSGTRFWPLSTPDMPKQFLTLFGKRSMLQETFDRIDGMVPADRILIITGERFVNLVRKQLPELPKENVIGEPAPRDTAAAMTLGTVVFKKRFGNLPILVTPADHVIRPVGLFRKTVKSAVRAAIEDGAIYTFGVKPTWPSSSYGYIECGPRVRSDNGIEHFELMGFKEKPDVVTAQRYLEDGGFYWNSGVFVWTPDVILEEIRNFLPDHFARIAPLAEADGTSRWKKALREAFEPIKKISIDFGVMEQSRRTRVIRAEFDWNDVGGWLAIEAFLEKDDAGNRVFGDLRSHDSAGNIVYCETRGETVALVGVQNLVVVRAGAHTLVVHKDRTEEIKHLVQRMIHGRK